VLVKQRRNVYLCQVNYQYGANTFLPYSVGMLQAYAQTNLDLRNNFEFHELLFLRNDPNVVARAMDRPAILGLSCYVWNWEYNNYLAQAVKAYYPDCLVIMGGTQVPDNSRDFFVTHPHVDILVHGEGEYSFASILSELLENKPDFSKIGGISIRINGCQTLKTSIPNRLKNEDLIKLPSPYLTGVFDSLIRKQLLWSVSQETNRGCPYPCTFCVWGGPGYQKLFQFEEPKLIEEFEWFGRNKIEVLHNCDANYGILWPRDYELTVKMIETRARYGGYPKRFRMCTAKNSNDNIFNLVKLLDKAGMNKGATLSFQSMDERTLEVIKRRNIKITDFKQLMHRYREEKIATYTELIMGLPGETYETFKRGIHTLIDAGQHDALNVYVCSELYNTEMDNPDYVKAHGVKTVRSPILLGHSTPGSDPIDEYSNIVIETKYMSQEDWRRMYLFSWAVQCFHCLGLTQNIAIFLRQRFGLCYDDFYEALIVYFQHKNKTLIGGQIALISDIIKNGIQGGRLDLVIPKFGNVYWPLEEAAFLNLLLEKSDLYKEIETFVGHLSDNLDCSIDPALLQDLINYQSAIVIDPFSCDISLKLDYDIHEYFRESFFEETSVDIVKTPSLMTIKGEKDFAGDLEAYAKEIVWSGRKGGKFRHANISVVPIDLPAP